MTNQLKKFPNDNVTCISPWYELRIDANGSMRCCHNIRQNETEKSNLSFLDWFNHGNQPTVIRNNIANGVESSACSACYYNEKNKLISHRMQRNIQAAVYHGEYFKESLMQSPAYKRMNGDKTIYPAFMHITLSNLCNMKCRMCFPAYSSQLADAYKKIDWMSKDEPTLLDWTVDDDKWNEFLELVKNNDQLLFLHFMGGEPLYHKRFYQFINWCIDNDKTDFHLTFVTNGTIYKEDLFEKLKYFKSVQIEISIENMHETNDYVRMGSDYKTIQENILKFVSKGIPIVLRTVPQALSIMHYDTILDFALEHKLVFDSNVLDNPQYLKCFVLPKDLKNEIVAKIRSKYMHILSSDEKISPSAIRSLHGIKNQIESLLVRLEEIEPDNIEELRQKFVSYNKELDKISTTKFVDMYPKLLNFYAKYSTI
jgi:sulfatase maturation enzyme AslB (radical SAM superfamily)